MFVVHTVNQLEEAARIGVKINLVMGSLVENAQELYFH